ncbi:MAG: VOC family protein [Pseudomonadota bacterium]
MAETPSHNPPFHLAIPVDDLASAEEFYGNVLKCPQGRRSDRWIDFNFFGHQLVVHKTDQTDANDTRNEVDGEQVPVRHFGVVLSFDQWKETAGLLIEASKTGGVEIIIPPTLRHKGEPGEQHIVFVRDPAGNALEFKSLTNPDDLFAS